MFTEQLIGWPYKNASLFKFNTGCELSAYTLAFTLKAIEKEYGDYFYKVYSSPEEFGLLLSSGGETDFYRCGIDVNLREGEWYIEATIASDGKKFIFCSSL
jgi:hypothetical protein